MIDTVALREKVLDLAIRGKLVPQDPNDEPASVLLERIRAQKQQMVKDGKLKAKDIKDDSIIFVGEDNLHYEKFADGTVKCVEDEIPFELPASWNWCRLGVLFAHNTGKALNSSDTAGTKLTYITTSNLYWDRFELDNLKEMPFTESEIEKCTVKKGDLLVCEGGDIGRSAIWSFDEEIRIQNHIHRLRSYTDLSNRFFYYVLFLWKRLERIGGQGIGLQGFSSKALHKLIVPLPPHKEQITIVEKLDSILDSVDNLDELNSEFTIDVESVKKQILDLAIRGKLVSQNPGDEPASALLERIRAEKEELIKQGKIKRDKKESVIFKGEDNSYYEKIGNQTLCIDAEIPFELPPEWVWCRGYSCFSGMETKRPDGESFRYIDIDSIDNKAHKIKQPKVIAAKDAPSRASRAVQAGSVLFSFVRPYLENIAYVNSDNKDCIASTGFYVCNSNGILYPPFMYFLMISEYVVQGLNQFMKGDNSPSISKDNIENWLYPIPPINEQKLICTELEKLLDYIATIEKSLS
ncbi:MAG: restriction endonuclease subunit S [Ruminococcaceae bacterium]|nr:restriction endonuclease subunit S [Oscillospiraceae bacterium]